MGNDGKILSVVVTDGGFGYKYPLKVKVLDKCGIGAGVVAQAFTGTISETTIVYDRESDFEEYKICDPGEDLNSPVFDVSGRKLISLMQSPTSARTKIHTEISFSITNVN